jgi:hypothetical protein
LTTTSSPSPPAPDEELDRLILAAVTDTWTKVAVFIARVVDAATAEGLNAPPQAIAARLYALVEAGNIEAKGNVRRWRAGEVRRADPATAG